MVDLIRKHQRTFHKICVLCIPLVVFYGIEVLLRGGIRTVFAWIIAEPFAFFVNWILYAALFYLFLTLTRRTFLSSVLFVIPLWIIGFISYNKILIKGEPLLLRDFINTQMAVAIMPEISLFFTFAVYASLIAFLIGLLALYFLRFKPLTIGIIKRRVFSASLVVFLLASVVFLQNPSYTKLTGVRQTALNIANQKQNGFLVSLIQTMGGTFVHKPSGYTANAFDDIPTVPASTASINPKKLPTIIAVMGEAYADTRKIVPSITLSPDPFSPLREIDGSFAQYDLLSPVFGGSTANTEFEFLTGFSCAYLPEGTIAYQQYVYRTTPSLAQLLKKYGYSTQAVHSYTRSFWSRNTAYPLLGIDRYYAMDEFENYNEIRDFISDADVAKKIISVYEAREQDKPFFCFAVTMQNHGNYSQESKYLPYDAAIAGEALSDKEKTELETHSAGVMDTSKMMRDLMAYYKNAEEPVLLVLFGDHQPSMSVTDSRDDEGIGRYTTPCFFWANYDVTFEQSHLVSPNFLAPYLLNAAGIPLDSYFTYLYDVSKDIQAFNPDYILPDQESIFQFTPMYNPTIKKLQLLQYDILFGKRYAKRLFSLP